MGKLIYVCIPYSNIDKELSFAIANEVSSTLMEMGYVVFSPISQSHHIADYLPEDLRFSQEFWMSQDLSILRKCDELCVVYIGKEGKNLVLNSKGCKAEIKEAKKQGIKSWIYKYELDYENENITTA